MVQGNEGSFISLVVAIFFAFNSVGQVPVFLALLAPYEHSVQKKIIIRELLIALFVLLIFTFGGAKILQYVGISQSVIGIAGGLLLVLIALNLIFPKDSATKGLPQHEPLIVPLAIPGLAGPGSMATMMVFSSHYGSVTASLALFTAFVPSFFLIYMASYIKNYLGEKGLQAIERLGGMIICLIGIQMFVMGVVGIIKEQF